MPSQDALQLRVTQFTDADGRFGFLVSPEDVLDNNNKLIVPRHGALYETRLVPKDYQKGE